MRLFPDRSYGYGHLKQMERSGDVQGLIASLEVPRVKESAGRRGAVVTSLKRLHDDKAIPVLGKMLLCDSDELVRCQAAKALGEMRDKEARSLLRRALEDDSRRVQMWAMRSLGHLRDQGSVPLLLRKLDSPDWGCRAYAATALGEIGDERAIAPLADAARDENSTVHGAAMQALQELGVSPE